MKKKTKIISILFCVTIPIIFYLMDYKIPQKDTHKNWTTLKSNTDSFYNIDTIGAVYMSMKLETVNLYLFVGGTTIDLIKENGRKLKSFNENEEVTVDLFNNRIIIKRTIYNDTIETEKYISYDLKTLESSFVEINPYPLKETYNDYLKRKKIKHEYNSNNNSEYIHNDSIYTMEYIADNKGFCAFFKQLYPLVEVLSSQQTFMVSHYTDNKGKIYDIKPIDKEFDYSYFIDSMDRLCPNWNKLPDIITSFQIKSKSIFSIADQPSIIGNVFHFDLAMLPSFDPKGNSNYHKNKMYFDQEYINYFKIKFKEKTLNFKEIDYLVKDISNFEQLNIPKSDIDTIAFIHYDYLYRVYPRKK